MNEQPNPDDYSKELIDLQDYHGIKLSSTAIADLLWQFKQWNIVRLRSVLAQWKHFHSPRDRFPALNDLYKISYELDQVEWGKEKQATPGLIQAMIGEEGKKPRRPKLAEKAFGLAARLMSGQIGHEQAADEMLALEKEFPGLGWGSSAAEMRRIPEEMKKQGEKSRFVMERMEQMREADGLYKNIKLINRAVEEIALLRRQAGE